MFYKKNKGDSVNINFSKNALFLIKNNNTFNDII